ncbi:hypothetical protein [Viridibacterium curvum]|uniref:DUF4189 domain-containing protein n=1 Tax=Viridibacterium curvum TaxID=1101404 RepID=A0ABP9QK35_9RHOO
MKASQLISSALLASCLICAQSAVAALSFWKKDGVLTTYGEAAKGDGEKLTTYLTPEVKVLVLQYPSGSSWSVAQELIKPIEKAKIKTVAFGRCDTLICAAMFIAGEERQFAADNRPETNWVRLPISDLYFPDTGPDRGTSWSDVVWYWRDRTKLTRWNTQIRHGMSSADKANQYWLENRYFFHPMTKTKPSSHFHCWGPDQPKPENCEAMDGDAVTWGIVTTAERYVLPEVLQGPKRNAVDIPTPPASGVATLTEPVKARVSDKCQEIYRDKFLKYEMPRAFAVSSGGACYARDNRSLAPAKDALSACEKGSPKHDCQLYAVNEVVVFPGFKEKPEAKSSTDDSAPPP